MKNSFSRWWLPVLIGVALVCLAFVPSLTDFNTNQFGTANNKVAIKDGATLTNVSLVGVTTITSVTPRTNVWSGPTNTIDLSIQDQFYDTLVPLSITGFINKSNTVDQPVVLTVRNTSGSNVNVLLCAGVRDGSGTSTYVATNGNVDFILSLRYSPATGGHTNSVGRWFY